jgi:polysaccharide deacetylase family protein (PEP-CTERM system associated)
MPSSWSATIVNNSVPFAANSGDLTASKAATAPAATSDGDGPLASVLSFDVEEHHRIEAAAGLAFDSAQKLDYRNRMNDATRWILDELGARGIRATFFVVGEVAEHDPKLVRSIHEAGHEVASHGWDHKRVLAMNPDTLREDLRRSRDTLEQASGAAVLGYRAPTFSVVRKTAWAVDVLAELGFVYDSSIYPVRHDRYGIPDAPRGPFLARGHQGEILELPPATVRIGGVNVPVGGGGYFRLLPGPVMRAALAMSRRDPQTGATVLYFHPWEFDADQPRLPLRRLSRFRTYVGIRRSRDRLCRLLGSDSFVRAIDLARRLGERHEELPRFSLVT